MSSTVRRIRRFVQKMAQNASMDSGETTLATNCIIGISKTGSCKVSDIVRTLPGENLREMTRPFYDGLSDPKSNLDGLRLAWLKAVSTTANSMPFIAVDPSSRNVLNRYTAERIEGGTSSIHVSPRQIERHRCRIQKSPWDRRRSGVLFSPRAPFHGARAE